MHTSIGDNWGLPRGLRRRAEWEPETFMYLKKKEKKIVSLKLAGAGRW